LEHADDQLVFELGPFTQSRETVATNIHVPVTPNDPINKDHLIGDQVTTSIGMTVNGPHMNTTGPEDICLSATYTMGTTFTPYQPGRISTRAIL
jgi:hypothetical protein